MRLRLGDKYHLRKSSDQKAEIRKAFVPLTGLLCAFRSEDFLTWCLSPERNRTHNLFFLFPIVFGINFLFLEFCFFSYTKFDWSLSAVRSIFSSLVVYENIIKGSVERSLLPWAIFLIFTQNRPWKSEDHLCMLFFIEMSKETLEKSERTPTVSWRPWALVYSRDRPYNFSCLSALAVEKRLFSQFLLGFGVSFGE